MRKVLLAAAAAVGAMALGTSASASTVFISADHMVTGAYFVELGGTVDGNPFSLKAFESPDILTVSYDGGPLQNILVFCVDVFHLFGPDVPPVTYETGELTNNSDSPLSGGGTPLSHVISGEIGYLASLGQSTNDADRLAAIQGAIWQTEYSGLTITGGSSYTAEYLALAAAWGAAHSDFNGYADAIYAQDGHTQGFVTGGGVPEPASWALMIAGFGLAGGMLRRRRAAAATA
jgi:hypothetical protein